MATFEFRGPRRYYRPLSVNPVEGVASVMTDASLSAELRERSGPIWERLHSHPFLRELARGELPLDKFRFFLEQDVLYLPDFARCMALGAAKSTTEAELRFFASELDGTINLELPNQHQALEQACALGAQDRGGALGKAPANVAYTSFMLAVSGQGTPLEIMAAILPCAWSYVEIAHRLADEIVDHPVYKEWVGFYLTDQVVELVRKMRADFDGMVREAAPSASRSERLAEIFATSSRLEESFWQMAYTYDQWPDLQKEQVTAPAVSPPRGASWAADDTTGAAAQP
jgi:thiaminase (transcriptional activator TenA)